MARLFLDTSVLIKLYYDEPNSAEVKHWVSSDDDLLIARITPLEFCSAFMGLVRQGKISLSEAESFIAAFEKDISQYLTVSASPSVFENAQILLHKWAASEGLRPLDALQLASALEEHRRIPLDALITTDEILIRLAKANGLIVQP